MSVWNWLAYPLGIRGGDIAGFEPGAVGLPPSAAGLLVLGVAGLVGLAVAVVTYMRTTEPLFRRKRVVLAVVRAVTYILVLSALCGVSLWFDIRDEAKPGVLVLVDDTRSMSIACEGPGGGGGQEGSGTKRIDRAREALGRPWLDRLGQGRALCVRGFSRPAEVSDALEFPEPLSDRTDLPAVLEGALGDTRGRGPRDVILITDGRDTVRTNYDRCTAMLRERGTRLSGILVGDAAGFRDVRLTQAATTPYCRAFDQMVVSFLVHHQGGWQERTVVDVRDADEPDKVLGGAEVTLGEESAGHWGTVILPAPSRRGLAHLIVRVHEIPGEAVRENNVAHLFVQVVDEPMKVLYVDNFPRPEFKHIKQALDRDPNIALTLLNRMPGGAWQVQGPTLLERPESGFPAEPGELLRYDVLILGSVSRGYFSAGDLLEERKLRNIVSFVSDRGGGLIVLGGHRSFGQGKYRGSPLDPLLPFEVPEAGDARFQAEEVRAELTSLGRYHPMMQLAATIEENQKVWDDLPELQGCNRVGAARPGAQVLAVSSKEADGTRPILLASQQYGLGRVLACTTFSTFRWRLGTPVERGNLLARFWAQAVRYVSPDPRIVANAINIQHERPDALCGEVARLMLRPLDAYYTPLRNATIRVNVHRPDGSSWDALVREDPGGRGAYPLEFRLDVPGVYEVSAGAEKGPTGRASLVARVSSEEFDDVRSNGDRIAALAAATGGKVVPVDRVDDLLMIPPEKPKVSHRRQEVPLRDCPMVLVLILGLGLGEWFFRKRNGLA